MELELKMAHLNTCETGGELLLSQEETAETIVPDYCPDIARIIETNGAVYLHSRELRDGRAELSGMVQVTVLYTPDGESGIRALEFSVPFSVEGDAQSLEGCSSLAAEVEAESLETRLLNPRKLFTRCKLNARITGWKRVTLSFATDAAAQEYPLEIRKETRRAILLTQIAEREFTFTDDWNLSPGRPGAYELLSSRVAHTVTESKLIGNKLIFKGIFSVSLLYNTEDGTCCSGSGELPFSQILDVTGAPEEASAAVTLQLTGADIRIDSGDPEGRRIAVTLYLRAMALLRQEQELEVLNDLYSTACELHYDAEPLALVTLCQRQTRREAVRELLEIGVVAAEVIAVWVDCGAVTVSGEGERTGLRTAADVRILYRDEGGVPLVAERRMEISCAAAVPEDCAVTAWAVCPEEPQGSIGERGIEVRFPVDFCMEAVRQTRTLCVASARLDTDTPKDCAACPSLVLRRMGGDETAWDLAKACNSTISAILAANGIAEEADIPRETLILIPRQR